MKIVTKRFLLRDFIKEDEPSFFAYHADPQYAEFCAPEEVAPSHTHELLRLFSQWAAERPRRNYQFAIVDRRNSQELIGCCGLRREGYGFDQAELGIELAPQFWGRYDEEAFRAALEVLMSRRDPANLQPYPFNLANPESEVEAILRAKLNQDK